MWFITCHLCKVAEPVDGKAGCEPRSLTAGAPFPPPVINVSVPIGRRRLCKPISAAVLYEVGSPSDPWRYLISCLMTYKYFVGLTVATVGDLSPWCASWVWEDHVIFSFGLEQCLTRPSIAFPLSGYIPLPSCYYQKRFLSSSLLWVRPFPWSHTWAMTHICQDARAHFKKRICVSKRITLYPPLETDGTKAIFHFFSFDESIVFLSLLGRLSHVATPER